MSVLDPMWTKPMKISDRAMDPLGMNRVSDRITNELLTGITVMTSRARYYSFYVWNVYDISKRVDVIRYEQFTRAFYDRERTFMMACIAHQETLSDASLDHSSILGSIKGQRVWGESGDIIKMTFPFLANRLGGYGYYYRPSIASLGLTEHEDPKDTVTELGKKLALFFEKSIDDSKYFQYYVQKELIPKSILLDYGEKCCLCMLPQMTHERNLLREILFGLNKEAQDSTLAKRRRETLSLILYCIHQAGKRNLNLESESFLDSIYYHQLLNDNTVIQLHFPDYFNDILERWRIFRAHDYFSYACESLLSAFLKMLDTKSNLNFQQFIEFIDNKNTLNYLSTLTGTQVKGDSLKEVKISDIVNRISFLVCETTTNPLTIEVSERFDNSCNLKSQLNEHMLTQKIDDAFESNVFNLHEVITPAFLLLFLLYLRFYHYWKRANVYWRWLGGLTLHDLSPFRILYDLEQKLREDFTLLDFINWFVESYVIHQAQEIYNEKALSGGFSRPVSWFHKEGTIYVKDRDYFPRHRNSRFDSCYIILKDLGLSEFIDYARLTKDGMNLFEKLGIEVR